MFKFNDLRLIELLLETETASEIDAKENQRATESKQSEENKLKPAPVQQKKPED